MENKMLSERQIRINEFSYEDYINWVEYSTEDSIPELRNHDMDFHLINYIYMIEFSEGDLPEYYSYKGKLKFKENSK